MSRAASTASHDHIRCIITTQVFFDPVIAVSNSDENCGHCFEKEAIKQWMRGQQEQGAKTTCPTCRAEILLLAPALLTRSELETAFSEDPALYNEVYFDLAHFQEIFEETKDFNTPIFRRYITLLEKANTHLNAAIHILANALSGRDLLRKKLRIDASSGKFFFGQAEISTESLQMQVNKKTIREWLNMPMGMELMLVEEQSAREAIVRDETAAYRPLQTGLFSLRRRAGRSVAGGGAAVTAEGDREYYDAVNPILQHVVYGEESNVSAALESVKNDPTKLAHALSETGTVTDYSNRTITGMTLLQAAAAAGDIDMCHLLKNYMTPEEFADQLTEIFPHGVEAHESAQKQNAFNFDAILAAIRPASTIDLDAALDKQNNGSTLYLVLERFRDEFTRISITEKIFNPQHLLRAHEAYNAFWDQCEHNDSDYDYKKRDLFWRQIIGYIQRFMTACYAQAFAQGLYNLIKVDQDAWWRLEPFKRVLKLRNENFSYFPLSLNPHSGLGSDFAIDALRGCIPPSLPPVPSAGIAVTVFSKTFVEQKQLAFRTLFRECESGHERQNILA